MDDSELRSFAVTPGVGQVFFTPDQLQSVAEAVSPNGRIELNSFQQLILHAPAPVIDEVMKRLRSLGLGVYAVGAVVKNLHTCTFCMGERIDGLPDAKLLDEVVAGTAVPFTVRIGFSGCQANCGEALMRDIGVVRMGTVYDIFAGGRAGGTPPVIGQQVAEGVRSGQLPAAVQALLHCYRQQARGKERFWKAVRRLGVEPFRTAVQAAGLSSNDEKTLCTPRAGA